MTRNKCFNPKRWTQLKGMDHHQHRPLKEMKKKEDRQNKVKVRKPRRLNSAVTKVLHNTNQMNK